MISFIIVGTQRTGSSAFAEAIGSNPKVCCGGEFTLKLPIKMKIRAAKNVLSGDFSYLTKEGRKKF